MLEERDLSVKRTNLSIVSQAQNTPEKGVDPIKVDEPKDSGSDDDSQSESSGDPDSPDVLKIKDDEDV